jgi:mono/diheme cytochrome c family protein
MSPTRITAAIVLLLVALVPPGLIALRRSRPSAVPPLHPILDMVRQPRFGPQRANPMFADGRAMRQPVPGTEAREDFLGRDQAEHDRLTAGLELAAGGKQEFVPWQRFPVPVGMELMRRGQERFNIYCAACHGAGGYGDGMVARRAAEMQNSGADTASGWAAPTSYHSKDVRDRPAGHIFNTISHGIRTMPAYDKQIPVFDRWAIVAYVKALQRSQNAKAEDVPLTERGQFEQQ